MKKFIGSLACMALAAGPAFAADLAGRTDALPSAASTSSPWTGFHFGLNAGGTWGNSASISTTGFPIYARPQSAATTIPVVAGVATGLTGSQSLQSAGGFIGGAQFGYDFQYGRAVFGVETDFQGVAGGEQTGGPTVRSFPYSYYSLSRDAYLSNNEITRSSSQKTLNYIGTARARVGYLFTPDILVYATGGFAYGGAALKSSTEVMEISELTDEFGLGHSAKSGTLAGWTAGGGVEWMFASKWSAKLEYLYYDLGRMQMFGGAAYQIRNSVAPFGAGTPQGALATVTGQNVAARFNGNILRVGVNYHFDWGDAAPLVAKF
jgi:outer membrane immunogenic protein